MPLGWLFLPLCFGKYRVEALVVADTHGCCKQGLLGEAWFGGALWRAGNAPQLCRLSHSLMLVCLPPHGHGYFNRCSVAKGTSLSVIQPPQGLQQKGRVNPGVSAVTPPDRDIPHADAASTPQFPLTFAVQEVLRTPQKPLL